MSSFLQIIEKDAEVGILNLTGNLLKGQEATLEPGLEAAVTAGGGSLVGGAIALIEKDDADANPFVRTFINTTLTQYAPQLEALLPTVAATVSGYVPQLVAAIFALKDKIAAG